MLRWLLCGVAIVGTALQAQAADLDDSFLRGSSTVITAPGGSRWDGVYVGAQAGLVYSGTDFSNATSSLVAFMLRNTTLENETRPSDWSTLGKADTTTSSYGGFIGYQQQWDEVVIGIEANYNRTNITTSQTDSISRRVSTSDGLTNDVRIDGTATIHMTDYGTMRVRGGWAAGNFMPYAFAGVAIGRADVSKTATVSAQGFDATGVQQYNFNQTSTEARTGDFAYGYAAGLGLDMSITQNIFLRGEYEYVQFGAFNDLRTHIHTVRAGAGFKF